MMKRYLYIALAVLLAALACYGCFRYGHGKGYADGNRDGYNAGYNAGYHAGYEDRNRLAVQSIPDTVTAATKTETKVIYQKIPYTGNDVQIRTEPPKVRVEINGKAQEIVAQAETADLAVKTEASLKMQIPERRWTIGIGTDGHKATYMLKAPLKGAVGIWAAGGGRNNRICGGVSVSF